MPSFRSLFAGPLAVATLLPFVACDASDPGPPATASAPGPIDGGRDQAALDAATLDAAADARVDADAQVADAGDGGTVTLVPLSRLSLGGLTSCLASSAGKMRCWGSGSGGELARVVDVDNSDVGDAPGEMPPKDGLSVPTPEKVVLVSMGAGGFGCVLTDLKRVRCHGTGDYGVLGTASAFDVVGDEASDFPSPVLNLGGDVAHLAVGYSHACAVLTTGKVRCWGSNDSGELGNGTTTPSTTFPPPDVALPGPMVRVFANGGTSCALSVSGQVYCWGSNYRGILARGMAETENVGDGPGEMPPPPSNYGGPVRTLALGGSHACALLSSGEVRCVGDNAFSPLGIVSGLPFVGDKPTQLPPANANTGADVVDLAATSDSTCALYKNGEVRCFGNNRAGQCAALGDPTVGDRAADFPRPAVALGEPALAISGGGSHVCALLAADRVRCWGNGGNGQLGTGATSNVGDDEPPASLPAVTIFP